MSELAVVAAVQVCLRFFVRFERVEKKSMQSQGAKPPAIVISINLVRSGRRELAGRALRCSILSFPAQGYRQATAE